MKNCTSIAGIRMKANTKVNKILPIVGEKYDKAGTLVRDMKTIGIELSPDQALTLGLQLITASRQATMGKRIRVTGHRHTRQVTTLILRPLSV